MKLMPSTTLACAVSGDDLVGLSVSTGLTGARRGASFRVREFLRASPDQVRAESGDIPASATITLVVPSDWAGVRPIALSLKQWPTARGEIIASIDGLFPMTSDDALVGLIEQTGADAGGAGEASGGYLVAIQRSRVQSWIDHLQATFGRPVTTVVSPHFALPGLGLQGQPNARIIEQSALSGDVEHRLQYGQVRTLCSPLYDESNAGRDASTTIRLPDLQQGDAGAARGEALPPEELALAAALAPEVAPGTYAPPLGRTPQKPRRWLAPASAAILAIALLIVANQVREQRFEVATAELLARQAELRDEFQQVADDRREARRLARLMREGVLEEIDDWSSILPDLAVAIESVPQDGFLYDVEITPQSVTMSGEAVRSIEVLSRLEASDRFEDARRTHPPSSIDFRPSMETFNVKADRRAVEPGRNEGDAS